MPSREMSKTKIGMRSRRRSPLRNAFEVSPQVFWAQCSTRWLSAQHFRSIIQPNYHQHLVTRRAAALRAVGPRYRLLQIGAELAEVDQRRNALQVVPPWPTALADVHRHRR